MSIGIKLFSERVGPAGGASASSMQEAISSTHYGLVQTVLREALQNSCDARLSKVSRISFSVSSFAFESQQIDLLRQILSPERAGERSLGTSTLLTRPEVDGLLITDSGTSGLGGGVDPSFVQNPDNFTGFFFRIGRDKESFGGGGSQGVGRAALFQFSECSTCLVYSRYLEDGQTKSRFMGMALGPSFIEGGRKFTGRHWYCSSDSDDVPQPLEGALADHLATELGMTAEFTHSTGTAILVIQPELDFANDEDEPISTLLGNNLRVDLVKKLVDSTVLFAWPHIVDGSIDFTFKADSTVIELPNPFEVPCIRDFARSYIALSGPTPERQERFKSISFNNSQNEILGNLAWEEALIGAEDQEYQNKNEISKGAVALMRQAKFVVKYLPISTRIDSIAIRGVFMASESFESDFRKSEPAAHDEWLPARLGLPPGKRNPVRQALERITKTFNEAVIATPKDSYGTPLVGLANRLGQFFSGSGFQGPPPTPPVDSSTPGIPRGITPRKAFFEDVGSPEIVSIMDRMVTSKFTFIVRISESDARAYRANISAFVALIDQPRESSKPINSNDPHVSKVLVSGEAIDPDVHVFTTSQIDAMVEVFVQSPVDLATAVSAQLVVDAEGVR